MPYNHSFLQAEGVSLFLCYLNKISFIFGLIIVAFTNKIKCYYLRRTQSSRLLESVFDFSVRHIHRLCSGKAGRAERKAARHFIQIPDRHIPQGIGSNFLPDSVYGVAVCDELLVGRHIGSKITGI